jgi:hypothetical protein
VEIGAAYNDFQDVSLAMIGGAPAVSYIEDQVSRNDLIYRQAADLNGSAWSPPVEVATGTSMNFTSLCEVNTKPAIAFSRTDVDSNHQLSRIKAGSLGKCMGGSSAS